MALRMIEAGDLVLEIDPYWKNPRSITGMSDEELREIGHDVKQRGQMSPLLVQRVTNGATDKDNKPLVQELVLDGQRRVLGVMKECGKNFKLQVIDYDEANLIELNETSASQLLLDALATGHREGLSSWEQSETAERLHKSNKSHAEIGRAIRRSPSWVSRMLKARANASEKLMASWKKGEITDDQFKDLAVEAPAEQPKAIKELVELRESGDKSEAFARQKEIVATAKAKKAEAKPVKPEKVAKPGKAAKVAKPEKPAPAKEPTPAKPTGAALADLLDMAAKHPPIHDYVKGVLDAVRYATGLMHTEKFAAPWKKWLARISGQRPTKKKVKAVKAKRREKLVPKKKAKK